MSFPYMKHQRRYYKNVRYSFPYKCNPYWALDFNNYIYIYIFFLVISYFGQGTKWQIKSNPQKKIHKNKLNKTKQQIHT